MKKLLALVLALGLVLTSFTGVVYAEEEVDEFAELEKQFSDENTESMYVSAVTSPTEIIDLISEDIPASFTATLPEKSNIPQNPEKVVVDEEGWLFIYVTEGASDLDVALYSNAVLTAKVDSDKFIWHKDTSVIGFYVKPGTYYYVLTRWMTGSKPINTSAYVGFMPSTARIKVDKIAYSKDKSTAAVTFTYDKEYVPDFNTGSIRVINRAVNYTDLNDKNVWQTKTQDNALKKNIFYATKNGKYSVRISGDKDEYYCQITFEIDGLKDGTLKAPKITTPQAGATKITGTGAAYTTVYVKVGGKTIKETVDKNGKWSVATSKLKKGDKISAYLKNTAGTSSKTTSIKIK